MSASIDAGPLIWLAKCGILTLLKNYYPTIIISEAVYKETPTQGLEKGLDDAKVINTAVEEKWITVHTVSSESLQLVNTSEKQIGITLGLGEREAIALAIEKKVPFLTDDEDAHRLGKALGLDPKGVLYVLLRGVRDGFIDKTLAKETLGEMLENGFWLSPLIIQGFYEALDAI
jgi:predicted nucleic acid-binding protein